MEQVYLVDDDPAVRKSLTRVLREAGFGVEEFDSAEAFLARAEPPKAGCIVLDVTMPGLDGLELQARLQDAGRRLPIVFLTGYGDIPMSVQAIKSGATDFLTKPVKSNVLVDAVRKAIDEAAADGKARAELAIHEERLATLTAREREVLQGLVKGRLNKQIAGDLGITERTVKLHRTALMAKLEVRSVAALAQLAQEAGVVGAGALDFPLGQ